MTKSTTGSGKGAPLSIEDPMGAILLYQGLWEKSEILVLSGDV